MDMDMFFNYTNIPETSPPFGDAHVQLALWDETKPVECLPMMYFEPPCPLPSAARCCTTSTKKSFRCAYRRCARRFASTDGVRKHARRDHPMFAKECKGFPNKVAIKIEEDDEVDRFDFTSFFVQTE